MQKDIKTKLGSEYSSMPASPQEKAKGLADFNNNVWTRTLSTQEIKKETKTAPEKTAAQIKKEEDWALITEGVTAIDLEGGSWTGPGGQKVTYSNGRYRIDTTGEAKGITFDTKSKVLQYLKKGYYQKK